MGGTSGYTYDGWKSSNAYNFDSSDARQFVGLSATSFKTALDNNRIEDVKQNNTGGTNYASLASSGVSLLATIGSLYQARQNYKLAKKEFKFNRMDSNRNYALAKDSYDRKVARAEYLDRSNSDTSGYKKRHGNASPANTERHTAKNKNRNKNTNAANKQRIADVR